MIFKTTKINIFTPKNEKAQKNMGHQQLNYHFGHTHTCHTLAPS